MGKHKEERDSLCLCQPPTSTPECQAALQSFCSFVEEGRSALSRSYTFAPWQCAFRCCPHCTRSWLDGPPALIFWSVQLFKRLLRIHWFMSVHRWVRHSGVRTLPTSRTLISRTGKPMLWEDSCDCYWGTSPELTKVKKWPLQTETSQQKVQARVATFIVFLVKGLSCFSVGVTGYLRGDL